MNWKHLLLLALIASGALATSVAPYAIAWSRIGGGTGFPSTGGGYSLQGTVGQHDAGTPLTQGTTAFNGGFWAGVHLLQSSGAPRLTAERISSGGLRISWPLPAPGFVLEHRLSLDAPINTAAWSAVNPPYETNAALISVTLPTPAGAGWYRLRQP